MKRFVGLLLICVTALAMLLTGTAYAANTQKLSIAEMRQDGGNLYLYLTGVDGFDKAALDTTIVGDYSVTMGSTQLPVSAATACSFLGDEIVHYVVCVDVSKSIGGSSYTKESVGRNKKENEQVYVKTALHDMINGLQSNERMTLYTFGNQASDPLVSFSNDKSALNAAVDAIVFDGNFTALYEVINKSTSFAMNQRKLGKAQRSAVLIITDGTDDANGSSTNYTFESIRENVRKNNVPVYTATFFRKSDAPEAQSLAQLQELADLSGGHLATLPEGEGTRMSETVTNLQDITRSSTRLTAQLHSGMDHGDGTFTASMEMEGGALTTNNHSFVVSWNQVPEPPMVEKFEINDITEDSTAIQGVVEPNSTVEVELNGKPWLTSSETGNGKINIVFKNQLGEDFHLSKGDTITVTATDADGNTNLPDGNDARVTKKVGESGRAEIKISKVDGIAEDGVVYGDSITVRGSAQEDTELVVSWQSDEGDRTDYYLGNRKGKPFNCTLKADNCTLGTGTIVVFYADYLGYSKQGYYEKTVNWIREKPIEEVPVKLEMPASISEDSKSLEIKTEPNAEITLIVDGSAADLGDNNTANDQGVWEYQLVDNDSVTLRKDKKLKIMVTDSFGRTAESEEYTIAGSTRKDFAINVSHLDDGTVYSETLKITGQAERNTPVNVSVWDSSTNSMMASTQTQSNGNFTAEFSAEECGVVGDEGTECIIRAEYADNLGDSKMYDSLPILWVGHEPKVHQEAKLEVKRLFEDSDNLHIESEPNTEVTVENLTQDEMIGKFINESGVFDIPLGAEGKATLRQDDEIQITVVFDGEEKSIVETVKEAKRKQISVTVQGLGSDATINQEAITVQGVAEPKQLLTVEWQPNDAEDSTEAQSVEVTASQNGWYEAKLDSKQGTFTEGYGSIYVSYADGLAISKAQYLDVGRINWIQVTPSPTPSPTPLPTVRHTTPPPSAPPITPTPEPEPEPAPTKEGIAKLIEDSSKIFASGDFSQMIKDWHFWLVVGLALLLIGLIVWLVLFLIHKSKEEKVGSFTPDDDIQREGEFAEAGTERQKAPADGSTTRRGPDDFTGVPTGTVNMSAERMGMEEEPTSGSGTIRLSAGDVSGEDGGTVRISANMGPSPIVVNIFEAREWAGYSNNATIDLIDEATIGRADDNEMVIRDETVSGHHLKLIRREDEVYVLDMMSSNGTTLNGQRISVETKLNSGDKLIIGRTTLIIEFE